MIRLTAEDFKSLVGAWFDSVRDEYGGCCIGFAFNEVERLVYVTFRTEAMALNFKDGVEETLTRATAFFAVPRKSVQSLDDKLESRLERETRDRLEADTVEPEPDPPSEG